jgi:hypothetical protein
MNYKYHNEITMLNKILKEIQVSSESLHGFIWFNVRSRDG